LTFIINKYSLPRGLNSTKKFVEVTDSEHIFLEEQRRQRIDAFSKIQKKNKEKLVNGFKGTAVFVKKGVKRDNPYSKTQTMFDSEDFMMSPTAANGTININSTQNIHINQPTHI
jgi:hypothetical protein